MNAIQKAINNAERSYLSAKSAVGRTAESIYTSSSSAPLSQRTDLGKASEQLRHFTSWVYAAVRPIACKVAQQPVRVASLNARRLGLKWWTGVEPLDKHPILDLLADPNDLMVSWSLMYVTVASLQLTGRALWWIPKREQILPIPAAWLVNIEGSTSLSTFKIRLPHSAETVDLQSDEVCYFAYPNPADPWGCTSPLQAVAGAVDADTAIMTSQAAMFRHGIHPSHAIRLGKDANGMRLRLTNEQQAQIISAIKKRYSGVVRHGEPLILDAMIEDVFRLSSTAAEMDYLNSAQQVKERILQTFGVSGYVLGSSEPGSRAASAVAAEHFAEYTINPIIELLSQSMTEWLSLGPRRWHLFRLGCAGIVFFQGTTMSRIVRG